MEKLEKITCPECNGNGRDLLSRNEACQLCDGRRKIFTKMRGKPRRLGRG